MGVGDIFGWVGHVLDGKLAVEAVAGEGGFGVVYRALHVGFQEQLAVKCLKLPQGLEAGQKDSFLRSFINEARLMRRLIRATSGVVEALDAGAAVSPAGIWTPYISMEWLAGESLELRLSHMRAQGAAGMSLPEALEFLWPVAEALSVAHEQGVVHCDIKPANIFLAQMASGVAFKLLDFGIARVVTDIPGIEGAGEESGGAMTPRYCAPEQINAHLGPAGPWTDLYSLALVLLEVASGTAARKGETLVDTVIEAMSPSMQPTFESQGIAAPAEAEALLRQALALEPQERSQSVVGWWWSMASLVGANLSAARAPRLAAPPAGPLSRVQGVTTGLEQTIDAWSGAAPARPGPEVSQVRAVRGQGGEPQAGLFREQGCTVLLLDLTDWQRLFAAAAPEEAERRLGGLIEQLTSRVEAAGGVVIDGAADRITAIFGVPRAHDNEAERALVTALQCVEEAASLGREPGLEPGATARAAVHAGRGWWHPSGKSIQTRGPALAGASRLLRVARDGEVVVSDAVLSRVAGAFNIRERGVEVDGAVERGFVVGGKANFRSPLPRGDFFGAPCPLRGREGELGELRRLIVGAVKQGCSRWVELRGAAGLGRTRLLFEVTAYLAGSEHSFFLLAAKAEQQEQARTYGLLAALLRARFDLFHLSEKEPISARILEQIGGILAGRRLAETEPGGAGRAALAEDVAILAELVSEPEGDAAEQAPRGEPLPRSRVIAAATRVLGAVAGAAPVVVLCDDVHLADDPSQDLLAELVERLRAAPFVLITSRLAGRALPDLLPGVAPAALDLAPLPEAEMLAMVLDRVSPEGLAPVADALARRSGGNPALLDEQLHLLIDAGTLERQKEGGWAARPEGFHPRLIPTTPREVCLARLRLLDPHEQRVLSLSAFVGETFWQGAVSALREVDPEAPVSDMKLLTDTKSVLARLKARGLIQERPRSRVKGEIEYGIADAALREVACEMVPSRLLTECHRAAARWLVEHAGDERQAAAIADHLEMVGDTAGALRELARAAEYAARYGQNDQALRVHQRIDELLSLHALACSSAALPSSKTLNHRVAGWTARAGWACARGDVLQRLGRLDEAAEVFERALSLIPALERRSGELASAHEPLACEWRARLSLRRASALRQRGDHDGARSLALHALDLAGQILSFPLLAEACQLLSNLFRRGMELDGAVRAARQGLRACRAIPEGRVRTELSVDLLRSLGSAFMAAQRPVRAERICKQAMQIAARSDLSRALSFAINDYAAILYLRGRLQEAIPVFLRSLALKERDGDLPQIAIASSNIAEVLLQTRRAPEALGFAQRAEALAVRSGAVSDLPEIARNVAEIHLALGQHAEAAEAASRSLRHATLHQIAVYLPGAAQTAARVLSCSPTSPEVVDKFHILRALLLDIVAAHPGAPWAASSLAAIEQRPGSPEETVASAPAPLHSRRCDTWRSWGLSCSVLPAAATMTRPLRAPPPRPAAEARARPAREGQARAAPAAWPGPQASRSLAPAEPAAARAEPAAEAPAAEAPAAEAQAPAAPAAEAQAPAAQVRPARGRLAAARAARARPARRAAPGQPARAAPARGRAARARPARAVRGREAEAREAGGRGAQGRGARASRSRSTLRHRPRRRPFLRWLRARPGGPRLR